MSVRIDPNSRVPKKFIGIPWKRLGRDTKGIDCIGLTWLYLTENGIKVPDTDGMPIPRDWKKKDAERMLREVLKIGDLAHINKIKKFDLLLFTLSDVVRKFPDHMAVMVDHAHFLHILEDGSSYVQEMTAYWRNRLLCGIRLDGSRVYLDAPRDSEVRVKL